LPAYRLDLGGERKQQLNIQWAGELRVLRQSLVAGGWHQPPALTPRTALHWLLPHASLDQLPMVPQLNNGQYESLVLVHAGDPRTHPDQQLVLRMWPTAVRLRGRDARVWIGTVAWQGVQRLPLVSFPHNANGYGDALERLRPDLKGLRWKIVQRPLHAGGENARPSGDTLLVCVTPK
jgi:undecaprenyl-diphosphatase